MSLNIIIYEKFYLYKNIMPENEQNLEGIAENVGSIPSEPPVSVDGGQEYESGVNGAFIGEWLDNSTDIQLNNAQNESQAVLWIDIADPLHDSFDQTSNTWGWQASINESMFLDSWEASVVRTRKVDDVEGIWKYLRWFFFSSIIIVLSLIAWVLLFSFDTYIEKASQVVIDLDSRDYVAGYKSKLNKIKDFFGINYKDTYSMPKLWEKTSLSDVNKIVNATDIDYIDKKDLLSNYVSNLVSKAQENAKYLDSLKQAIAKQWFLPQELEIILENEETIDTIQRSLNALEIVKFSTATKVFSYMNTALATIAEMVRVNWSTVENLNQLFQQLNWRWEKDISHYVYLCHLNPYETSANCDTIWDLDLYYNSIIKDNTINIKLFKNSMSAISQLLEKEDTTLFSITFNWFNAQDENIVFNVEVYTSQEDEKTLKLQWKKNPNIFILTNIINLLKQSSFIIGAEINTKEINVETKTLNWWGISRNVNYTSMDFSVPIQKDTEREIFDYIDLASIEKMISEKQAGTD